MATYDLNNPTSIEAHGKKLVGKTLRTHEGEQSVPPAQLDSVVSGQARGIVGQAVERYYYGINPGNTPCVPDFQEVGGAPVELKVSPLKRLSNGKLAPKERLVFGMIDYMKAHQEAFDESCFLSKNRLLMALWYVHENQVPLGDLRFVLAGLIEYDKLPETDKAIIREDWKAIVGRVASGEAHLLGSAATPTRYLEAITKGASGQTKPQVNSDIPAKPRAFAFKTSFLQALLRGEFDVDGRVFEAPEQFGAEGFEALILKRFTPYLGMTELEIARALQLGGDPTAKGFRATLARAIIGVRTKKVAEFDRANIVMKTVAHQSARLPREHMSFPAFRFMGEGSVLEEVWDVDDDDDERLAVIKKTLADERFLFVVFQTTDGESRLEKAMFWSMPEQDLEAFVRPVWEETRRALRLGDLSLFPTSRFNEVSHVRPHATKGETWPTPRNGEQTKRSFWLDRRYIARQVGIAP